MTVSDWYFLVQTQQKKLGQGRCSSALIPNPNSTPCRNVPTTNSKQIYARWAIRQDISSSIAFIQKKKKKNLKLRTQPSAIKLSYCNQFKITLALQNDSLPYTYLHLFQICYRVFLFS